MISAVPSTSYKVKTKWLKEGCVCVNVATEKNFEKDVRDKVCPWIPQLTQLRCRGRASLTCIRGVGIHIRPCGRQSHNFNAPSEFVRTSLHRVFRLYCIAVVVISRAGIQSYFVHAFTFFLFLSSLTICTLVCGWFPSSRVYFCIVATFVLIMSRLRLSHYKDVSSPSGSEDSVLAQ